MGYGDKTELHVHGEDTGFEPIVIFMDTKREKEIGLGADWPFDPMKKNECIINKEIAKNYDIEVG